MGSDVTCLYFEDRGGEGRVLSRSEVLALWVSDDSFCACFSKALADSPLEAFFWETPSLSPETIDLPFECILMPAPSLARQRSDPRPFAAQFEAAPDAPGVIAFENLGGDASLIVPCDTGDGARYGHMAAFLRTAAPKQIRTLWRQVGQTAGEWLARGQTCWISTSGLGVSWLHIRIDSRPKYYGYAPYR